MKRLVSLAALTLLVVTVPLLAQSPKGWKVRADRSTSASDPDAAGAIKFVTAGSGFHATTPQAAVFWNPANTISGNYTLKGSFKLLKPSGHTNYYGLVFGGSKTILRGRVSNIFRPSDVAGVYGAAGAGLALGSGARAIVLTNQKGAVLELSGVQTGLMANADLSGLAITMK